jgi:hypothetical protein
MLALSNTEAHKYRDGTLVTGVTLFQQNTNLRPESNAEPFMNNLGGYLTLHAFSICSLTNAFSSVYGGNQLSF